MVAAGIMDPHRALPAADRRQEGPAVASKMNPFFFGDAGRDLFGRSVGETLAPDVISVSCVGGKVHPLPVGRPRGIGALRRHWTNGLSRRTAVERRQPT